MASTEPKMKIGIGAETGDFEKGAQKVKREMREMERESKASAAAAKAALSKVALAFAAVTAAITGIGKALEDLSKTNQKMADSWGETVAGMKAAWDSFKLDVANSDFTGAIERARLAAEAAREYYKATDWDFEVENANRLILAEHSTEIEELNELARNQTLTAKERIDAINRIFEIIGPVYDNAIKQSRIVAEASLNKFINRATGKPISDITEQARKEWTDFIKWLGQVDNREMYNAAVSMIDARRKKENAESYKEMFDSDPELSEYRVYVEESHSNAIEKWKAEEKKWKKRISELGGLSSSMLSMIESYYLRTNDESTKQMVDDVESYLLNMAAESRENRRLNTLKHSLEKMGDTGPKEPVVITPVKPAAAEVVIDDIDYLKKMLESYSNTVDLLHRKIVAGAELVKAGWEDAGDGYETLFTQLRRVTDQAGEEHTIAITPILSNGQILSPDELASYVKDVLDGADDILSADKLGIVVTSDADELDDIENLVNEYYAAATAVQYWTDVIKQRQEAEAEANKAAEESARKAAEEAEAAAKKEAERMAKITDTVNELSKAIVSGFSDATQELMDQLFEISDSNGWAVVSSLLTPLADLAIKMGEILITVGLGIEAFKDSLSTINPYVAMAAGAALIAIGTFAKAGLKSLANGNYSSSASVATSNSTSSFSNNYEQRDVYVNVEGTLRADGDQLVAVINNSNKKKYVTT